MQADLQLVQATFQPVKAQVFPSCTLVFFQTSECGIELPTFMSTAGSSMFCHGCAAQMWDYRTAVLTICFVKCWIFMW